MAKFTSQDFNPNFSNEIDIESMIGAPLVAASKANVTMVTGQTRFLLEYCFHKDDKGTYSPVMIQMSMTKGVVDETNEVDDHNQIKLVTLNFAVPLICIVPINSLAIDKVSVDFDLEITSSIREETKPTNGSSNKISRHKARLHGKITNSSEKRNHGDGSNQKQPNSSSHLKVSISASPLPLTSGVLTILDIYTKSIQPISVDTTVTSEKIQK